MQDSFLYCYYHNKSSFTFFTVFNVNLLISKKDSTTTAKSTVIMEVIPWITFFSSFLLVYKLLYKFLLLHSSSLPSAFLFQDIRISATTTNAENRAVGDQRHLVYKYRTSLRASVTHILISTKTSFLQKSICANHLFMCSKLPLSAGLCFHLVYGTT